LTQVECLPGDWHLLYEPTVRGWRLLELFGTLLTLSEVPAAGICENRYCPDGEKGVWASGGGGHAEVRSSMFVLFVPEPNTTKGKRSLWRRRFKSVVYQADARICGRRRRISLLYDVAEG